MTVTATSLASGTQAEGEGTSLSFDIDSVSAPAHAVLALWLAASPGVTPSVSGLDLTWTTTGSTSSGGGNLYLVSATVGGSSVSDGTITVSYSGAEPAVAWDLDCVSGDAGETPSLGIPASGAVTAENENDSSTNVSVTFPPGPVFYLFGSCAIEQPEGGSAGESPTAWTELAHKTAVLGWAPSVPAISLETQVSPDASNPVAKANWGWVGFGYWCAVGIPVMA